jgi:hypothetical protein
MATGIIQLIFFTSASIFCNSSQTKTVTGAKKPSSWIVTRVASAQLSGPFDQNQFEGWVTA